MLRRVLRPASDTIAAIATAAGGGLGVLRLSGPAALAIGRSVFSRDFTKTPRRMVHGHFFDPAAPHEPLDDGLAVAFFGPASFTGEDVAELHLHGGALHLTRALEVLVRGGARPAEPGEFSRRAFLNGKLDLTRAEAIADLVAAQTDRALRQARAHLAGALRDRVGSVRDRVLDLRARIEVNLDFVDEHVPLFAEDALAGEARAIATDLRALASTFRNARRLKDGATVVLAGPPNAGKSSLFNALCEADRAIVTAIAGTTRDTLREHLDIRGLPVLLVDTAGLRDTDDEVERHGVARSERAIADADLVLVLVPPEGAADSTELTADPRTLVVRSKADLRDDLGPAHDPLDFRDTRSSSFIAVSATTGLGLDALRDAIAARLGALPDGDLLIVRERQHLALSHAADALDRAADGLDSGLSPELPAVDLQEAMDELDGLVGRSTIEDVLDRLFTTFCIGK